MCHWEGPHSTSQTLGSPSPPHTPASIPTDHRSPHQPPCCPSPSSTHLHTVATESLLDKLVGLSHALLEILSDHPFRTLCEEHHLPATCSLTAKGHMDLLPLFETSQALMAAALSALLKLTTLGALSSAPWERTTLIPSANEVPVLYLLRKHPHFIQASLSDYDTVCL